MRKMFIIIGMFMLMTSCEVYKHSSDYQKALASNNKAMLGVGVLEDDLVILIKEKLVKSGYSDSLALSTSLKATGYIMLELRDECKCASAFVIAR